MDKVFSVTFGAFPLRFIQVGQEVFVAKLDFVAALSDCFTPACRPILEKVVDGGLELLGDEHDQRGVVLGESSIGLAIHFHAVGNLLASIGDLTGVDNLEMRETGFRVRTFARWYARILGQVSDYFGHSFMDVMSSVKRRLDRLNPAYEVIVSHEDGVWVAECDELGLVTEADSYEALTDRAWAVAPELCELNGLDVKSDSLRLAFRQTLTVANRIAL